MTRPILPPYTAETFPENTTLPEGARSVLWTDSFGCGVAFKPGIVYAQRDGMELHIHALTPRNDRKDNPMIVYVQGSAWFKQDLYIHLPEMVRMCQKGYCVALVEYRPSTTAAFPAQAEDAKTAIRFLRANAEKFRFDPERMALWGDSSGGHTVLMAGITGDEWPNHLEDEKQSAGVKCIVDWYGPTVVSEMAFEPSLIDHISPDCPEGWLIGHLPVQEHLELSDKTIPQRYLREDRPTPPILIMHGSRDMTVNFQQSVHLYEALREMGKECEFIRLEGADHGWRGFACDAALDAVDEFLKKHL